MDRIGWPAWKTVGIVVPALVLALGLGVARARSAEPAARDGVRLAWLAALGSEAIAVHPRPVEADGPLWASVPGMALAFAVDENGALSRVARLPADFSSAHGLATSHDGAVVASRQGELSLWQTASRGGAPTPRWRRPLGARVTSVAWAGGDQVWAAMRDGRLLALASRDGTTLWSVDLDGRAVAAPVADGGDLYVATQSRTLSRIDTRTGVVRWRTQLPGPVMHAPALTGGDRPLVLCGTWNGTLAAFEAASGRRVWSVDLGDKLAGALAVGFGRVAAATEAGEVRVYDVRGQPVWTARGIADGPTDLSVASSGGDAPRLLVASQRLAWVDLETGETLESYPEGARRDLRARFVQAMMDGEKTWSESEKHAAQEREAFAISAPLFGPARRHGDTLVFGTEDGWVHLFDLATLRPLYRYRAGRAATGLPRLAGDRLVAAAGDEVFALAPDSGALLWRRGVGGNVREVTGRATLAVLTGQRLSTLDALDGTRGWTERRGVRFVSAEGERWLVGDAAGRLRVLDSGGKTLGELRSGGTPLRPVALEAHDTWAVATAEGHLLGVAWTAPGGLERIWKHDLGEPISEMLRGRDLLLVRIGDGSLLALEPGSGREVWRIRLAATEQVALASGGSVIVYGGDTVRIYDLSGGRITFAREARAEAVGVALDGSRLRWLDRAGFAHSVDIRDGRSLGSSDLGVPLEAAAPAASGFVVRTAGGEIGLVVGAGGGEVPASPSR